MPLREEGATTQDYYSLFPEAKARLLEAIKFAKKEKSERIVVIGYGLGGLMASYMLSEQTLGVNALITISLPVPETKDPNIQVLSFISKSRLPMLDVYGSEDLLNVVESARDRQVAGKKNSYYQQVKIENEGHLYLHADGSLEKRIYSWIDKVVSKEGPLDQKAIKVLKEYQE